MAIEKWKRNGLINRAVEQVQRQMDKHGYGLGECGYFFEEARKGWVEYDEIDEATSRQMRMEAEERAEKLEKIGGANKIRGCE